MFFKPEEVEAILLKVIDLFLIPRFRELRMNATGEWLNTLGVEALGDSGVIKGRQYSEQLAKGRLPGKKPPIKPLQKWAMAKFGADEKRALGIAYAVAQKIEKEGTTHYKKGGTDLIEILESPKVIEFIQNELGVIAQSRITEQLIRNAEEILL